MLQNKKIASIDIGTNTLLMLVAEIDFKGRMHIIEDYHLIARLGEGVDLNKNINENAIARAKDILNFYKMRIDQLGVDIIEIVGTSALRDSENRDYVASILSKVIGTEINIISGEEEARLSFIGSIDLDISQNTLVLDIGGGSTELIYGEGKVTKSRKNFDIGAVRLTERYIGDLPVKNDDIEEINSYIKNQLNGFEFPQTKYELFAVAGTPTTLAQMVLSLNEFDYSKIHNYKMSIWDLQDCIEILKNTTKEDLIANYKIHQNRADIILAGALILNETLKYANINSFYVNCHGLRYGVLINYINKNS